MRTKGNNIIISLTTLLGLLGGLSQAAPLGTAFNYQGKLNDGGGAVTGVYDFRFALYDNASGGTQQGSTLTFYAIGVTNGLVSVTLDFGNQFNGNARWLDISLKTNGAATYTLLTPRQQVTPHPYALYTPNSGAAATATSVANNAVTAQGIATGEVVKSLNNLHDSVTLAPGANLTLTPAGQTLTLASPTDWHIGGNNGTTPGSHFLGTTDNQALELWVNNGRALRLEPNASGANIIGGSGNTVSTYASIIGGGAGNSIQLNAYSSVIAGGRNNQVQGNAVNGAIAGFIGGGQNNVIESYGYEAAIGGGYGNRIQYNGDTAVISGGSYNVIGTNADYTVIGGGSGNHVTTEATGAMVGGGVGNVADMSYNAIVGGQNNWAGDASTGTGDHTAVGGGQANKALGSYSIIGGGYGNLVWSDVSCGELGCYTNDTFGIIGGGQSNQVSGIYGTIAGGFNNWAGSQDFVGGGAYNRSGMVGGLWTSATTIGGGVGNYIIGYGGVIGGGVTNTILGPYAVIGGGLHNEADGAGSFIGGGGYDGSLTLPNSASGSGSVIAGGTQNIASGSRSTIGGGHNNSATNWYATVPGGAWNLAGGQGSFAAGQAAKAIHNGAFVWNDNSSGDLLSTAANSVSMRASGGYRLYSSGSAGVWLAPGAGSWTSLSDREAKENVESINSSEVLEKVVELPLATWNYKSQDTAIRHLGPMAQDFKAAFSIGETETGISTVDADGVALAAIQGLNQKVERQAAELQAKDEQIRSLADRLSALESRLTQQAHN